MTYIASVKGLLYTALRFISCRTKKRFREEAHSPIGDTSRKMKKFLLKCDALKSDKEVLEHAFELFGPGPIVGSGVARAAGLA